MANDGGSEQAAMAFAVRSVMTAFRVSGPTFWWGSNALVQDSAAAHWFIVDRRGVIQPGVVLRGFTVTALGLTEPVRYRAQGFHEPPPVAEGQPVQTPPSFWTNSVGGVTVGVVAFPSDSTPGTAVARLAGMSAEACALGWLTGPQCSEMTANAQAASQALAQGDTGSARTAVEGFLAQTDALADQARALLLPNAAFALRRLVPGAGPTTRELDPVADTYIRSGNPNQNQGSELILRVRPDGDNRTLIRFDQSSVAAEIGTRTLVSARLEFTIIQNFDNWGPAGRTLDLHRLSQGWTESGATWNCGDDLEPGDPNPDCPSTAWEMSGPGDRPWVAPPTAFVTVTNGQRGVISLDVTGDVTAYLSGQTNFGWLLKRTDEGPSGAVDLGSRESPTPPRLVLTVQ